MKNKRNNYKASSSSKQWLILAVIITSITFFIYSPSVDGEFVYDDIFYITNNFYIHSLTLDNLISIWTNFTFGNYNPITITSFAFDYAIFGMNTVGYHIVNIILHIAVSLLVYVLIMKLHDNRNLALVIAVLFAIHPIHVESVSWISGRKDLLYSLFFILSMLVYVDYLDKKSKKKYLFVFLLFILSCLSKPVAVVLPLILFIVDYLKGIKISSKTIIEKIPFFVLSILFSIITIYAQSMESAVSFKESYSIIEKISLSFYAILFYIYKIIVPINLSANYAYPSTIGIIIYLSPVLLIILMSIAFYLKKYSKNYLFYLLFFVICLLPVIQIVSVGNALTADRFAYMASLGLIALFGFGLNFIFGKNTNLKYVSIITFFFISLFYTVQSHSRAGVWKDEFALFSDMIDKNPDIAFPYNNLGLAYFEKKKDYQKAEHFLKKAIEINPGYSMAFNNLGNLYDEKKDYRDAIEYYIKAITLDPLNYNAMNNCGLVYYKLNEFSNSEKMYRKALQLKPDYYDALNNYANLMTTKKDYRNALLLLKKATSIRRKHPNVYINLAGVYLEMNEPEKAKKNLQIALKYDANNQSAISFLNELHKKEKPDDEQSDVNQYHSKAVEYFKKQDFKKAIEYYLLTIQDNPNIVGAYIDLAIAFGNISELDSAIKYFNSAIKLQPDNPVIYKNLALIYYKKGNNNMLVKCYRKAAQLGDKAAQDWLNANNIKW